MARVQCEPNQFTCDDICLELSRKCDKIRDCLDRSDEENCGFSTDLSDFDRIAQLGLVATIVVIALVLLIILVVVLVVCMRRMKRRQLASVEVIQVPSHYIKTQDGIHSSVASTASGPTTLCSNVYSGNIQPALGEGETCGFYARQNDAAVPRSQSRRSNRSRRSTSSGRHRRHVPAGIAQSPSDSGMAATGSTTVSTSAAGRPSSVHSSLHYVRHEAAPSIPAAFRHSFHGNLSSPSQQGNSPQVAAIGQFETPPPPYSTFDRTVYAGQVENCAAASTANEADEHQAVPHFFGSNDGQTRNGANPALSCVERNILYDDSNNLATTHLINSALSCQQRRSRQSPVSPYTREWIARVACASDATAQPTAALATYNTDDTLRAEQSYAQQIRQALRKNQNPPSQTQQVPSSGFPASPTRAALPPTRPVTPQYSQIVRRAAAGPQRNSYNAGRPGAAAITKRPVALNV